MGYEVLTAFFLEAGFLGIALFGRKRVGDGLHMFAVAMVALGTLISATWILAANSWMQTPAGYAINDNGQFLPADWWADHLQPVLPLPAGAHGARGVPDHGVRRRRGRRAGICCATTTNRQARIMFSMAMWMAALVTPLQIFAGDLHGLNTLEHQPAKIAAMEGHYETQKGAPLILFGIPDDKAEETHFALEIPDARLADPHPLPRRRDQGAQGLPGGRTAANALIPFFTFRIMVGLGFLMLGVGLWSLWARLPQDAL